MTETDLRQPLTSDATTAVRIEHLDIVYKVYEDLTYTSKMRFMQPFHSRSATRIHAIKDLSLDIAIGEALGILGSNGSGKSTLLRAIAGVQSRHSGRVLARGDVRLLGVGASLKPALSGYRNVMLGGLAMGLSRGEIEEKMEEVAEFSGLGTAMSRPMATYSSGMRARLAFSIATLRTPDVLLVDEALAVGDKDFRSKSLARIDEIREGAGTVVMVTHNLGEIRNSCTRAIWLDDGRIIADGDVDDVIRQYEER